MKNELEEIESQCMLFNSKARKLASDLQDVEEKVEHAETTLNVIWGKLFLCIIRKTFNYSFAK